MAEQDNTGRGFPTWWPTFVSANGILLVWYEAVISNFDRPWLLALAGGLVGVWPASLLDDWLGAGRNRKEPK